MTLNVVELRIASGDYGPFGEMKQKRLVKKLNCANLTSLKNELGIESINFSEGGLKHYYFRDGNCILPRATGGWVNAQIRYSSPVRLGDVETHISRIEQKSGVSFEKQNKLFFCGTSPQFRAQFDSTIIKGIRPIGRESGILNAGKVYVQAETAKAYGSPPLPQEPMGLYGGFATQKKKFSAEFTEDTYEEAHVLEFLNELKKLRDENYKGQVISFKITVKEKSPEGGLYTVNFSQCL